MKNLKYLLMLPIAAVGLMQTSCSDDPAIPQDEEVKLPYEADVFNLDKYLDKSVLPGNDFFMYCNGTWYKNAVADEDDGASGFARTDVQQTNDLRVQMLNDKTINALKLDAVDRCDAEEAVKSRKVIEDAVARIQNTESVEECWKTIAHLAKEGFQVPFRMINLQKGGTMVTCFFPDVKYEFESPNDGISDDLFDDDDDFFGNDDDDFDMWSAENMTRMLRKSSIAKMMRPIAGGDTRAFSDEEWPMIATIAAELGINANNVYMLTEDFPEEAMEFAKTTDSTPLKEIQELDLDELKEYMSDLVYNDTLMFTPFVKPDIDDILSQAGIDPSELEGLTPPDGDGDDEDEFDDYTDNLMETIMTKYMNYSLSRAFAEQYVTSEMKQRGKEMVSQLVEAFRERIEASTWLSEAGKRNAIEKLDNMVLNVAYPDKWRTTGLPVLTYNTNLVQDVHALRKAYTNLQVELSGLPTKEACFDAMISGYTNLTEMQAFYAPMFNSINILPVWLLEPIYMPEANSAYNFAPTAVFGHEISHGFDTQGVDYDKYGDPDEDGLWGSADDKAEFERRAAMLAAFYSKFENCDGDSTLAENIADLGGFELALHAYKNQQVKAGVTGEKLNEQLRYFYRSYANLWRTKYLDKETENMVAESDEHALDHLRVNGVVPNTDLWYDLFDVKPGQELYLAPPDRVHIW